MNSVICITELPHCNMRWHVSNYIFIECQRWDLKAPLVQALSSTVKSLSCVRLFATTWTVAYQAPLSMGFLQEKIQEWVAMPSSRGSSQPRDWTQDSRIAGRFFTIWATREALKNLQATYLPYHLWGGLSNEVTATLVYIWIFSLKN